MIKFILGLFKSDLCQCSMCKFERSFHIKSPCIAKGKEESLESYRSRVRRS